MVQRKLLAKGKGCRAGAQRCEDCVSVQAGLREEAVWSLAPAVLEAAVPPVSYYLHAPRGRGFVQYFIKDFFFFFLIHADPVYPGAG